MNAHGGRERLAAERAVAAIPGWAGASLARLDGGSSHSAWLVDREGRRAVLKFDTAPRSSPYNSRSAEGALQALAAADGLAARVLHVGESTLLSEYVEGEFLSAGRLRDDEQLAELARALRRLHRLLLSGRTFDARQAATLYFDNLGDSDAVVAECHLKTVLDTPAPQNLSLCHNDLVAANIVDVGGLRFIDWEFACDNDPMFDLATIVADNRLSTEQAARLLDAYFDGDGSRWMDALAVQEGLYEALAWLWRESRGRI